MEIILPHLGVEAVYTEAELETLAITVPNMTGYTAQQAAIRAEDLGVSVRVIGDGSKVTKQSPAAGSKMEREGGTLVVWMGEMAETQTVQVPNVIGMSAAAANRVLINAGLNIRITGTKEHLTGTQAQVITQSVPAGETVEPGTVVTLTFATANDNQ
jgi:beta-lactam-binding protein with PASTA domain